MNDMFLLHCVSKQADPYMGLVLTKPNHPTSYAKDCILDGGC